MLLTQICVLTVVRDMSVPQDANFGLDLHKNIFHICDSRKINPIPIGEILQKRNTTIIYFIRRFGCYLTRSISNDLNFNLIPKLYSHTQFIVIASENIGYEDFLDANFLSNTPVVNFFYDPGFRSFQNLEFKRYSGLQILLQTFSPKTFKVAKGAISAGITADLSGDVYQSGGLLIFQSGKVRHIYKQKKVSEFMKFEDILDIIDANWRVRRLSKISRLNSTESQLSNITSNSDYEAQNKFRTLR